MNSNIPRSIKCMTIKSHQNNFKIVYLLLIVIVSITRVGIYGIFQTRPGNN